MIEMGQHPALANVARILHANPGATVRIEGHTDNTGPSEDYNCNLSLGRAKAVMEHLAALGIAEERLEVLGQCDYEPVASNDTAAGRRKNRRVEFVLIKE